MKRFVAVAFAALCLVAGAAQAAEPTPPAAAEAAPSPKAVALIRRYLAAMHMKESFRPMMDSMMSGMLAQQAKSYPGLTPEQAVAVNAAVKEAFDESLNAGLLDKMMEAMVPSMARVFSEDELQALVDFYESPKGQAVIAKMPEFGRVAGLEMGKFVPEMQADLQKRVQQKLSALHDKEK